MDLSRISGSLTTGDVCSFKLSAANFSAFNSIELRFNKLNNVEANIFSGGKGFQNMTNSTSINNTESNGRLTFPADTDLYIVFTNIDSTSTTSQSSFGFNYILNIPDQGTSNSSDTNS